jgi:hypothetical protein
MEGIIILGTIIAVIVSIAQICLFFKLWGMCNNVIKIRDVSEPDRITAYRICYMKGDMKGCKEKLDEALYTAILGNYYSNGDSSHKTYESNYAKTYYEEMFDSIVDRYSRRYSKVGLTMPDIEKYKDHLNFPL